MRHQRRVLTMVATTLATCALLLFGAASPSAFAEESAPPGKAWIRAGHLVPGVGTTRIDLVPTAGSPTSIVMSPAASYGDVTGYQKIDPGDYTVYVRPEGASLDTQPLLQRAFSVVSGKATTLAVVGTASDPRFVVLDDDLTPPASNTARVRVLPAASHATNLSVSAEGGPTLTSGAVLGQATDYSSVPAGGWTLQLTSTTGPSATQRVDLASGSVYTAVVLDNADTVKIKVITDAAGAQTTPVGAAATGGGAMAAELSGSGSQSSVPPVTAAVSPLLVALAVVLWMRRGRGARVPR
jgi:Domain of unknown function (DUF4397)